MSDALVRQAEAFERLERLEDAGGALDLELQTDGRLRTQTPEVRDILRDRLRTAELYPTGPGWALLRSRSSAPPRELLGRAKEVVAAGILGPRGWPIVDILGFAAGSSHTGVLAVDHGSVRNSAFFCGGDVLWASSTAPGARLGPFLLARGRITRDQLRAALTDGPTGVGRACVDRGYLAPDELEPLLRAFIVERFDEILQAETGLWSFAKVEQAPFEQAVLRLPTQALLVDGLRKWDEMRVYRQRVPGLDMLVKRAPRWSSDLLGDSRSTLAGVSPELPERAEVILRELLGATALRELVRRTGESEFEVTRIVFHLLRADLVSIVARARSESRPPRPATEGPRPSDVISTYQLALAEITNELNQIDRLPEVLEAVNTFLEGEVGAYRDLLAGIRLDDRGQLDETALLLRMEVAGATSQQLVDALAEILFFTLLTASEELDRRRGDDLARRVRLIHGMLRAGLE